MTPEEFKGAELNCVSSKTLIASLILTDDPKLTDGTRE